MHDFQLSIVSIAPEKLLAAALHLDLTILDMKRGMDKGWKERGSGQEGKE